ncbi:MAG: hypothetical protein B6242_14195 [Anaerolineaceae bacterium 4572_78]|nr:MAG: hypothetical protein B6242_14195 [Anaerolineaceae bacterium 4572_78]
MKNSWAPVFYGHFELRENEVFLVGTYGLEKPVQIFTKMLLGFALFIIIIAICSLITSPITGAYPPLEDMVMTITIPMMMFFAVVGMTKLGTLLSRKDVERIEIVIKESLTHDGEKTFSSLSPTTIGRRGVGMLGGMLYGGLQGGVIVGLVGLVLKNDTFAIAGAIIGAVIGGIYGLRYPSGKTRLYVAVIGMVIGGILFVIGSARINSGIIVGMVVGGVFGLFLGAWFEEFV